MATPCPGHSELVGLSKESSGVFHSYGRVMAEREREEEKQVLRL